MALQRYQVARCALLLHLRPAPTQCTCQHQTLAWPFRGHLSMRRAFSSSWISRICFKHFLSRPQITLRKLAVAAPQR